MTTSNPTQRQASKIDLPFSSVFPGRIICGICGLPIPPEHITDKGMCIVCDDEAKVGGTIATMAMKVPAKGFRQAIDEVRREGRPMTLDLTESLTEELGGAVHLGKMIAEDIRRIRGDDKEDSLRAFHEVDYKVLFRGYDAAIKLMSSRDEMVGGSTDPLANATDEDLMAIASTAAFLQLEVDPEFRRAILQKIVELEPQAVIDAAVEAIDRVSRPMAGVIVVENNA